MACAAALTPAPTARRKAGDYVGVAVGCLHGLLLRGPRSHPRRTTARVRNGRRADATGAGTRGGGTLERLRDRRDVRHVGTLHVGGELLLPLPQARRPYPHRWL